MSTLEQSYAGTITGTAGDDILIGPDGELPELVSEKWLIDGGDGNDTLSLALIDSTTTVGRFAQTGVDIWLESCRASGTVFMNGLPVIPIYATVENVENATGSQLNDRLVGDDGSNILDGQNGKDQLFGRAGDDLLRDGNGVDVMRGGSGRDVFALAADGDTDSISDFQAGQDRIDLSAWGVFDFQELTITEETKTGGNGNTLYRTRISFEDELLVVRDVLWTVRTDEITQDSFLFTGSDLPVLTGTDQADKQFGTAFAERINDGAGRDNLWGFGGADIFGMAADGDVDNIKDFRDGEDLIDVSAWGATGIADLDIRLGNNDKVQVRFGNERLTVKVLADEPVTASILDVDNFIFA